MIRLTLNGEVADALAEILTEQLKRVDEGETLGTVVITRQGLDGAITVAFSDDGRTFDISAGGTVEEI